MYGPYLPEQLGNWTDLKSKSKHRFASSLPHKTQIKYGQLKLDFFKYKVPHSPTTFPHLHLLIASTKLIMSF